MTVSFMYSFEAYQINSVRLSELSSIFQIALPFKCDGERNQNNSNIRNMLKCIESFRKNNTQKPL